MNIIERLKDKDYVRAFGLMSEEEQQTYYQAKTENCLRFSGSVTGKWVQASIFCIESTFAIKPDYQPQPEYVDLEIKEYEDALGVWEDEEGMTTFTYLQGLPALQSFGGFWDENGKEVDYECISRRFRNGQRTIAKVEKPAAGTKLGGA